MALSAPLCNTSSVVPQEVVPNACGTPIPTGGPSSCRDRRGEVAVRPGWRRAPSCVN